MPTHPTPLAILPTSERIQSLDVMRGIVLFGILIMNINAMGLANAYDNPTVSGGATGYDLYTWVTASMLFEGTMRALFSLLFGVGMFIFMDRLEKKGAGIQAANMYFRRITWLLVFGLVHSYIFLWTGEILYNYALMGFLVFSFRNLAPKKLIAIAVGLFMIGSLWNFVEYRTNITYLAEVEAAKTELAAGRPLSSKLEKSLDKWNKAEQEKSKEGIAEYNANMQKGYFSVLAFLAPKNMHFDKYYPYRYDVWDVLSMMLLGIALFKLKVLSAEKSYRFYGLMVLTGYGVGLTVNYYETSTIINSNFSLLGFSKAAITYDAGRVPLAMGHLGVIMMFCKTALFGSLRKRLAAVGKMALTNYFMHSLIAMVVFTGVGFGLFGKLYRHQLMYVVFATWIFQLIVSPIWLKYFYFGPVEWLWRNLTYLRRHPFRKTDDSAFTASDGQVPASPQLSTAIAGNADEPVKLP